MTTKCSHILNYAFVSTRVVELQRRGTSKSLFSYFDPRDYDLQNKTKPTIKPQHKREEVN